jgi:hypothetical protein
MDARLEANTRSPLEMFKQQGSHWPKDPPRRSCANQGMRIIARRVTRHTQAWETLYIEDRGDSDVDNNNTKAPQK